MKREYTYKIKSLRNRTFILQLYTNFFLFRSKFFFTRKYNFLIQIHKFFARMSHHMCQPFFSLQHYLIWTEVTFEATTVPPAVTSIYLLAPRKCIFVHGLCPRWTVTGYAWSRSLLPMMRKWARALINYKYLSTLMTFSKASSIRNRKHIT